MGLRTYAIGLAGVFVALGVACQNDVEVGADQSTGLDNLGGGAGSGGAAGVAGCVVTKCGKKTYACGDCIDNDEDGTIDSADSECLGACDSTEDSYHGGITGPDSEPCNLDCYFDTDNGVGNDGCYWSHNCDPLSVAPAYGPSGDQCPYDPETMVPGADRNCSDLADGQTAMCNDRCIPLTPNGCDCFGCCELPARSGSFVWIGSSSGGVGSCDEQSLGDPAKCRPCTLVLSCFNSCEPCEVCVGQQPIGDCTGSPGGEQQCMPGVAPCGRPGQANCGAGEYCITGCCVRVPE
jgi:hypothetical protein